jgi:hypothetical protein
LIAETPIQLNENLIKLKNVIITWRKRRIEDMHSSEKVCNKAIAWLDRQKKNLRQIIAIEKLVHEVCTERYNQIAATKVL